MLIRGVNYCISIRNVLIKYFMMRLPDGLTRASASKFWLMTSGAQCNSLKDKYVVLTEVSTPYSFLAVVIEEPL